MHFIIYYLYSFLLLIHCKAQQKNAALFRRTTKSLAKKCCALQSRKMFRKVEKMRENLFIKKVVVEESTLYSDNAFMVWCGLRCIMTKDKYEYFVNTKMLYYEIFGNVEQDRYKMPWIKSGLEELIKNGAVKVLRQFDTTNMIVDLTELYRERGDNSYFVGISQEEIRKVINLQCNNTDIRKLLRYYTMLVGRFNRSKNFPEKYKGKVGGFPITVFSSKLQCTEKTILRYNTILEDNSMIAIHRDLDFYNGTDSTGVSTLRQIPNAYSRFEDSDLLAEYVGTKKGGYKDYINNSRNKELTSNHNRSLGQKFRYFCGGKVYDKQTICDIYMWAVNKNKLNENKLDMERIDLSVFDKYLSEINSSMEENSVWGEPLMM